MKIEALFFLLTGVLLVMTEPVRAREGDPTGDADSHYRAAWELQKQAERSNSPSHEVVLNLNKTIEQCDAATKLAPDFCRAHVLAAHCLYRLAQLSTDRQEYSSHFQAARERFAIASRCPGVDAKMFREWGGMLIQEIPAHADRTDRLALLQEARRLFEVGLNLNAFSGERGRLERDLGLCLVLTAQNVTNVLEKRSLYEEAMRRFGSAAQVDAVAPTPQLSGRWGIALVEYGKLTNDRMALRQAVERLTTALEQDSQNNEARYNLACAYALLEQPGNAMRHLRVCLENDDSKRTYYQTALQDPDLSSLRRTREYYDLVNEKQPPRPVLVQPVITDR